MTIKVVQQLKSFTIEVVADRSDRVIEQLAFWNELPDACPICNSGLRFYHRQPQDFDYYGLICNGTPSHECNFGIRKEDHGLFYKADSWRKVGEHARDDMDQRPQYRQPQGNTRQNAPQRPQNGADDWEGIDADDLPWDGPDGTPERNLPDPFDWGDFLAQCRGAGVSGRHVREVIGGPSDQKIMQLSDILPWLKAQPNRNIAALVSQAATLRDSKR